MDAGIKKNLNKTRQTRLSVWQELIIKRIPKQIS